MMSMIPEGLLLAFRTRHSLVLENLALRQQIVEAFPWDTAPRYLLRDRDRIYGHEFAGRVRSMGIREVMTAPRPPWQSPYVERLIGTLRRDCLDYYHSCRTHFSLEKDSPDPRPVEPPDQGRTVKIPMVGGLHHRYTRQAA